VPDGMLRAGTAVGKSPHTSPTGHAHIVLITESCFVFHCIVVLAVRWHCSGRPNCELWPRLVTVQWS